MTRRATDVLPLLLGVVALAVGTVIGWNEGFINMVVMPPPLVRAALVGGSVVVGIALFAAALRRLAGDGDGFLADRAPDWPTMVRGIRLAFLGVAALAAAAGWALGHPLPIVVALVIAGVDVVETSFLVLVARSRGS
jgi:ribose/xylose/arabinose/galactoside ABC-type transport system permease subunit